MKTIYIRGDNSTGTEVLKTHLSNAGHEVVRNKEKKHDVTVCWGTSMQELRGPNLNGKVNAFNKFEHFTKFDDLKVKHPIVFLAEDMGEYMIRPPAFPWLARSLYHDNGKDITPVKSLREALSFLKTHKPDFFSVFIPTRTEYRVWVACRKAIAVYEKVHRAKKYTGTEKDFNFYQSFLFEKDDDQLGNEELCFPAIRAVRSINLDFGAVDVLLGTDGDYYVLEVNSMPNIDSIERVSGIRLAKSISKWAEKQ
jgi:RimK-like ATP-grasp domain